MSLQIYDKTTGSLTVVAASATRTWIGSKAAHDAEALANTLPNNCLLAVLATGLYYRDASGVESLVTAGGDSDVQVITMPTADSTNEGKVVQYIGATNANYTHNYWYECISDGATPATYSWQRTDVQPGGSSIQVNALPTADITELGKVYQYIGADTQDYKHGYFYECTFDGANYAWTYLDVDECDGNQIQFDTLPSPTVDYEGRIVQYTGVTNANYTNAYFYKCVSDGQTPATYSWERVDVQPNGQTIQVATLPTAAIGELGKIYQYTGATTQDFTHGYFYECVFDGTDYEWVNIPVQDEGSDSIQVTALPTADVTTLGQVLQYIGATGSGLEHGHFYECVFNDPNYEWVEISVSDGDTIQFSTLPTASAALIGKTYQYVGATNQNYTHNYFYECVSDGGDPAIYSWVQTNVQPDVKIATTEKVGIVKPDGKSIFIKSDGTIYTNIWIGTKAQYEEQKYKIPYDTIIYILDDGRSTSGENLIVNGIKIVPWASGTDAEIVAMITGADEGKINLYNYWSVGDERIVHLSAIEANPNGVFTTGMDSQDVTMVLMNKGYMNQSNINFVVGQKDCLNTTSKIRKSTSNAGSWRDCELRSDLNSLYYNAFPSYFKSIIKQFSVKTPEYGGTYPTESSEIQTTTDYFALFAETEIAGKTYYGNPAEENVLSQIEYYTNPNNRIKVNVSNPNAGYWERSPDYYHEDYYCRISAIGLEEDGLTYFRCGVAPFCCI